MILYFHEGANSLMGEHLQWRIPLLREEVNMVVFVKSFLVIFVKIIYGCIYKTNFFSQNNDITVIQLYTSDTQEQLG